LIDGDGCHASRVRLGLGEDEPAVTYLPEAWGNAYDFNDYHDVIPATTRLTVQRPEDLAGIVPLDVAGSSSLAEHIELVRLLRAELPEVPLLQTLFSPLSTLLELAGIPSYGESDGSESHGERALDKLRATDGRALHQALHAIATTQARYVEELVRAGADGIFYAVTGTVHPALTSRAEFAELSTPYDELVLEAAAGKWRILHTCGPYADPARFTSYPLDAVHLDQHAVGNPDVDLDIRPTVVGGVSHIAAGENRIDAVAAQAARALSATRGRPFLLAPSCSVPPSVAPGTLAALRASVDVAAGAEVATTGRPA
jgi:uroporphyrinogen decarboxylase